MAVTVTLVLIITLAPLASVHSVEWAPGTLILFPIGIAAVGAALGQGRAVAAAMESIGRNPNSADKIQTPMIIGIAFIESLAIYALVIAFTLSGNV